MSEKERVLAGETYCDNSLGVVKPEGKNHSETLAASWLDSIPLSRFANHRRGAGEYENVQVPKEAFKCVAFLCIDKRVEGTTVRTPGGTAFLVMLWEEKYGFPYVVTARHNIENSDQDTIYVRVNNEFRLEPGFVDIPTNRDDWFIHTAADVAAIPFVPPRANREGVRYTIQCVPIEMFAELDRYKGAPLSPNVVATTGGITIDEGDDVFFTGLFLQRPGREQMLPIVRFGNISRMPYEPISFRRTGGATFYAPAYLVEAKSWGGHSGSPAFWCTQALERIPVDDKVITRPMWLVGLLGLVSAHDDIQQRLRPRDNERADEFEHLTSELVTEVNSGIAIVTPATAIKELLMRQDVKDSRKTVREAHKEQEHAATMDSGWPEITSEDFEEALKRASRKLPDEESNEEKGKAAG